MSETHGSLPLAHWPWKEPEKPGVKDGCVALRAGLHVLVRPFVLVLSPPPRLPDQW